MGYSELLQEGSHVLNATKPHKLRLTEAARLVSENSGVAISEIEYSIGYANVSYFNKLFKEEYGCTPKVFRSISAQQSAPVEGFPVKSGADSPP